MTPESVLAEIRKMNSSRAGNPMIGNKDIGIDSLALSLSVKVQDLLMHLKILEAEGKVELKFSTAHSKKGNIPGKGVLRLAEE